MTLTDPFASAPEEPQPSQEPSVAPEPAPVAEAPKPAAQNVFAPGEGKIVTTFKAGSSFDSPWVVVHANSVSESDALLDQAFADYLGKVKKVASFFNGGGAPANNGQQAPQRSNAPAGATQPPAWFPPPPAAGWVYKTGFKKDGGAWHAWAPARKGEGDWQFHNPPK